MREQSNRLFYNVDWITIGIYIVLVLIGLFNIYSAMYDASSSSIVDLDRLEGKQAFFIVVSVLLGFALLLIDSSFFTATAFLIYGVFLLLNIAVRFLGTDIRGSHSWFKLGGFSIQPAEFMKFATGLALAKYISGLKKQDKLRDLLTTMGILLLPMAIIMFIQNETGVAVVLTAFIIVLYREDIFPGWLLLFGLGSVLTVVLSIKYYDLHWYFIGSIILIVAIRLVLLRPRFTEYLMSIGLCLWFSALLFSSYKILNTLPDHQTGRIRVWLGVDVTAAMEGKYGYNVKQSMIAIGSGGLAGKGYLEGTQTKFRFVPEQETDFIFCTVGEEWGFLGSAGLVVLYAFLIIRLFFMAERQRSDFSRIYGYAVASIFLIHLSVNVGMTIGLIPVIGIPLPFISYGGSSLIGFTFLLFIFIRLDSQRLLILR
jgi:rod shape determining protein RodA